MGDGNGKGNEAFVENSNKIYLKMVSTCATNSKTRIGKTITVFFPSSL